MSRIPKILGAILIAAGIIGVLAANAATPSLIVAVGIRAVHAMQIAAFAAIGVGAAAVALGFVPNIKRLVESNNRQKMLHGKIAEKQKTFDAYAKDSLNPAKTRTRMCRNMRNIINCCILVEDGSDDLSEFDNQIIGKALSDNENELQNVDTLIHYAVNYINNYQQNGVTDMSELKAWIEVMRQSTEESNNEIR